MPLLFKTVRLVPSLALVGVVLFSFLDRGGIPFFSHAVLMAALFGTILLLLFKSRQDTSGISETMLLLFVFAALFFVSLLFSKVPEYGLTEFFSIAGGFFIFALFASGIFLKEDFKIFHRGGLGLLALSLIIGIYAFVFLPFDRFTGPFLNFGKLHEAYPNNMASFLLVFLPFLLYFFFTSGGKRKYFYGSLLIASLSAFFLTSSRSAFLGFSGASVFVAVFWVIFYRPKLTIQDVYMKIKPLIFILILSAVLTAGLMFARSQYQTLLNLRDRIDVGSYEGGSGIKERLEFWRGSISMAGEHLRLGELLGSGPGSFKFFFPKYQKTFGIIQNQPHNYFLALLVENGIFTVLLFLLFLVFLCVQTLRYLKNNNQPLVWAAVFSIVSLVLAKSVDDNFNFVSVGIPFFAMLGFLAYESSKYAFLKIQVSTQKILAGLFVLSIPLAFIAVHEIYYNISFKEGKQMIEDGKIREGIEKLNQTKKLFWERDLDIHRARAYQTLYETLRSSRSEWESMLLEICHSGKIPDCGHDPEIYYLAGKFLEITGQHRLADKYFTVALQLDPSNNFKFYYANSRNYDARMRKKVIGLLAGYTDLVRKNAHFTLTTENPEYADELYGSLIHAERNPKIRKKLSDERVQYRVLWKEQLDKFRQRYFLR